MTARPGPSAVVCVGIATLDRILLVDRFATAPGKYRARDRSVVGGGVAANAAVTVARLGGRARLLGAVGDDPTGDEILRGLTAEGVEVTGLRTIPGARSPESIVQIDLTGERLIVNHASADLFERAAAPVDTEVTGAGAVLVDMRWPRGAVIALEAAARDGVPGIVDCDHDPGDGPDILAAASHVVFAAATLRAFAGTDDLPRALERATARTSAWLAVTDGARGSWWLGPEGGGHVPAVAVDVVDTLGAGDVFHGAFALALAEGRTPADALGWASAAAALKCTRLGGRAGIPTRPEVDDMVGGLR